MDIYTPIINMKLIFKRINIIYCQFHVNHKGWNVNVVVLYMLLIS